MHKSNFIIRDLFCLIALLYIPNSDGALLVSEREIEIESEKAWEQMKMSLPISRELSKRTQVNCIAKKIIRQLDEPFADEDWEIEVFENPGINAFAMPGGKLGFIQAFLLLLRIKMSLRRLLGMRLHTSQTNILMSVQKEKCGQEWERQLVWL